MGCPRTYPSFCNGIRSIWYHRERICARDCWLVLREPGWEHAHISGPVWTNGQSGTKMWEEIDEKLAAYHGREKGSVFKDTAERLTPLKRTSVPEDVAKLVSFFGSADSSFVTGQTYIVDGGIVMN